MDRNEIIDKILKVYNKSKNNPYEEEAKAALLKAQEMLVKYNLEFKDLNVEKDAPVKEIEFGKKARWWHGRLARILADNFKCKTYTTFCNGGRKIILVGKETDVNICYETFIYIKKAVVYNCNIHMSKRKLRLKDRIKVAKQSFITGFISGLEYALDKQKAVNDWGLFLVTPIEVQDYYDKLDLTTFSWDSATKDKNDLRSFKDGYDKGKEFNTDLNKKAIE